MDVTEAIQQINQKYGQGVNSLANSLSSNKSLNFAEGASMQRATQTGVVSRLPFTFKFKGTTGLFGTENQYFEIDTNIKDYGQNADVFEGGYLVARFIPDEDTDPYYQPVVMDDSKDTTTVNTYEPAVISNEIVTFKRPAFTVRVKNNGSGNSYEDVWLDVQLYTKQKFEHPEEGMIIEGKDKFYVGFHARNTRRLNYDVDVIIGEAFTSFYDLTEDQKRLMQRII